MFTVDIIFSGFSGKLDICYHGWGTWALIRDGIHNIMLDTGYVGLRLNYDQILASHGVTRQDIDYVLLTHMHFDHACNVDMYPEATFVVSRAEWEYANDPDRRDNFVEKSAIPVIAGSRHILVEDGDEIIPGITAMLTPGHTPGCCSYILDQGNGEKWVLAGDASKNRCELATGDVQMSQNIEVSRESIRRILAAGCRVLPGHDGWCRVDADGNVIPEGGNDKVLEFGQGVTINGGLTEITLHMD